MNSKNIKLPEYKRYLCHLKFLESLTVNGKSILRLYYEKQSIS